MKRTDKDIPCQWLKTKGLFLLALLSFAGAWAQEPLHNFGNFKIHSEGAIGFHNDFINDGISDDNSGLAGFYNENDLIISGAFRPIFEDMEIVVTQDLFLEVGVGVTNNSNYIVGNVFTPRSLTDISHDFINDAFYTGAEDNTKVDGYAASNGKQRFLFPIGDADKLRPLELFSENTTTRAKCAYFLEDPNTPSTFPVSFDTAQRTDILTGVSTYEFWDLDSSETVRIALTWDNASNLGTFISRVADIRIVGWNTQNGTWENLGGNTITGTLAEGELRSDPFVPDDYSAITFGSSLSTDSIDLGNYLVTPDGDGVNDVLYFDAISLSPNNELQIFNRWGRLVYTAQNYENTFDGNSNGTAIVRSQKRLPDGIYFYILTLSDIGIKHQGFLSLNQ
ncbi:gliding motility-associated C-terminal domain-containing protein [Maribacter sp. 2-571]|uniref:gliding motility-associated C-terminal domain-containing protein n=1 Tax=Maribacter sp. 2-571 TaxID=3417569 RepID=UPI003D352D71